MPPSVASTKMPDECLVAQEMIGKCSDLDTVVWFSRNRNEAFSPIGGLEGAAGGENITPDTCPTSHEHRLRRLRATQSRASMPATTTIDARIRRLAGHEKGWEWRGS